MAGTNKQVDSREIEKKNELNKIDSKSATGFEFEQKLIAEKIKKHFTKYTYEELIEEKALIEEGKARSTRTTGTMGLIVNNKIAWIEPVTVQDDRKLIANVNGPKQLAIFEEPLTVYMNMRNHWGTYGFIGKLKMFIVSILLKIFGMAHYGYLKFNLYGLNADGEYTLPILKDRTPEESQRKVEEYLKIANPSDQGRALSHMMKGLGEPESWWKTGQWLITILLIIFMFLYVMNGGKI